MKRKIKIVIFFNNLKGFQIYNNIKSKIKREYREKEEIIIKI